MSYDPTIPTEFRVVRESYWTALEKREFKSPWWGGNPRWTKWKADDYYSGLSPDVASIAESAMAREIEMLEDMKHAREIKATASFQP